ncbi:hypothetical protein ACP70R_047094 [Stipagrostis hirtigluma subsp. patula]
MRMRSTNGRPPSPPQRKEGSADDEEEEESESDESDEESSMAPALDLVGAYQLRACSVARGSKGNGGDREGLNPLQGLTEQGLKGNAAATDVAKSPPPKKPAAAAAATQVSKSPVATKEVGKSPQVAAPAGVKEHHGRELKCNSEKHLEEKSESYWYLWQQVLALGAEHPGMSLKEAFLKIPHNKVKKQMVGEINQHLWRQGVEKEVVRTPSRLLR